MDRHLAIIGLLLGALLVPAGAAAQDISDRSPRIGANLTLGFAGELDALINDTRSEVDLDPSVGFDLRVEVPVLDFLVVGGFAQLLTVQSDASGADREEAVGFDVYARLRWVFEVADASIFVEPYVLVPFGLTLALLDDDNDGDEDVWPGWNTAVLAGAQVLHRSGFGGYLEVGWRHAEAYNSRSVPILGNVDLALVLNEMALHLGFVYAFGGR